MTIFFKWLSDLIFKEKKRTIKYCTILILKLHSFFCSHTNDWMISRAQRNKNSLVYLCMCNTSSHTITIKTHADTENVWI